MDGFPMRAGDFRFYDSHCYSSENHYFEYLCVRIFILCPSKWQCNQRLFGLFMCCGPCRLLLSIYVGLRKIWGVLMPSLGS